VEEGADDHFADVRNGALYGNHYDSQGAKYGYEEEGSGDLAQGEVDPETGAPIPSDRYQYNPYGARVISADFSESEEGEETVVNADVVGATTTNTESSIVRRHSPYTHSVLPQEYNPSSEPLAEGGNITLEGIRVLLRRPMATDFKKWLGAVFRAQYFLWSHNEKVSLLAIRLCALVETAAPHLYRFMTPEGNSQLYRELSSFGLFSWFYSIDDCRGSLLRFPHDLRVSIYPYEISYPADKRFDLIYEAKLVRLTQLRIDEFFRTKFIRNVEPPLPPTGPGFCPNQRSLHALPITALSRISTVPSQDREFWNRVPQGPPKRFICFHFTYEARFPRYDGGDEGGSGSGSGSSEDRSKPSQTRGAAPTSLITLLPHRQGGKRVRFTPDFRPRTTEASIRDSIAAFKEKLLQSVGEGDHSIETTRRLNGVDLDFSSLASFKCSRLKDRKRVRRQLGHSTNPSHEETSDTTPPASETSTPPPSPTLRTPAHRVSRHAPRAEGS
jgi:hypothetical protein